MKSKWWAQVASFFSATLALLCPLCIPAVGAFLASIGLGFALNVVFLRSLLVFFLVAAVASLVWSAKLQGKWVVVVIGVVGAAMIYIGRYVWFNQILMGMGAFMLIGISILNFRFKASCNKCE
ncbi:MAG: MerC family mercury resistance protein [Candidatus Omnitrophota bacterium]|nr:MerC family mercury resistance protein [Candidatus Omnitrophota bacterium]